MEKQPDALLLKFPGTNCDAETARALAVAGFRVQVMPLPSLTPDRVMQADLLVLSGGFSYGDYIMAGRLAQLKLQACLGDTLKQFRDQGGRLLGICNGFQILVKLGLLPVGSLIGHTNGRFACRWVTLHNHRPDHPFFRAWPAMIELPIACGEGRFIAEIDQAKRYRAEGLVALTYADPDVTGSVEQIAGLIDSTGRVCGMMPHPERFLYPQHHYDPDWDGAPEWGWGYFFFRSIFESIQISPPNLKKPIST